MQPAMRIMLHEDATAADAGNRQFNGRGDHFNNGRSEHFNNGRDNSFNRQLIIAAAAGSVSAAGDEQRRSRLRAGIADQSGLCGKSPQSRPLLRQVKHVAGARIPGR